MPVHLVGVWEAIIVSVVPSSEMSAEHQARIIAAGRAAASWARARRGTWTAAPLPTYVPTPEDLAFQAAAASAAASAAVPAAQTRPEPSGPPIGERIGAIAGPAISWALRLAVAAAVLVALYIGVGYVRRAMANRPPAKTEETAAATAPAPGAAAASKGTGNRPASIEIKSEPPSAQVILDGKPRGITPTTISDVAPGKHVIELKHKDGIIERTLTLEPGENATVDEQIFAGWVGVFSPIDVTLSEGGRELRPNDQGQVMLPPGPHEIRMTNKTLDYDAVQKVVVKPGEVARITATPPKGSLTVSASEPSDVFVDGKKIGSTPLNGAEVELGSHEVIVIRNGGGQRRFTVTATTKPLTISADFSK